MSLADARSYSAAWDLAVSRCAPRDAIRSDELARACNLRSARGLTLAPTRKAPQYHRRACFGPPCAKCGEPTRGKGETGRPNASGICTACRDGMSSRTRDKVIAEARAKGT